MIPIRTRVLACALAAGISLLSACAGDFTSDPARPRQMRALASPVEQNSTSGELNNGSAAGIPLIAVEFPNTKEEQPKIRTIADSFTQPPATRPTNTAPATQRSTPTTTRPATHTVDPVFGE